MEEYINIDTKQFRGDGFMTIAKYNNLGDIIYIADKDSKIIRAVETKEYNVFGNFNGHNGVIWSLDVSSDDKILVSCSGDLTICFWQTENGNKIHQFVERCIPKYTSTQKKLQTNLVSIICEVLSKKSSTYILIYDLDKVFQNNFSEKIKIIWNKQSKPTVLTWLNEEILIIGCDDGKIVIKNINDTDETNDKEYQIHDKTIKSIVWNKTKTQILTGSLDCTAKQIDIETWKIKSTYKSIVPINWACWNHNDRKIFVGGGIEAMNVAKTSNNDLNLKVYRVSDQKLINHMASHFGPIRYIDKSPSNKNFLTASQDGTVKIYFIKDDESNNKPIINEQTSINEEKLENLYNNFSSFKKIKLISEINKLENLNWKPKQIIEKKINWVPGMPMPMQMSKSMPMHMPISNPNIISHEQKLSNSINTSSYNKYSKSFTNDNYGLKNNNNDNDLNERINQIKTEQEKKNSTIRVTNLPSDIKARELAELFDLYGRIAERDGIKIKNYEDTTMAFIKYIYSESATKAINNLDYTAIDNYIIRVELARQK